MEKELWIRADIPEDREERKELVISALESGVDIALVRPEDSDFEEFGKVKLYYNDNGKVSGGVELVELRCPEDQDRAMDMAGKVNAVILDSSDWTVIPLENLIAKFRDSGTKVLACADDIEQAKLYMQTLEKGVDGVVINTLDPDKIRTFANILSGCGNIDLSVVEVESVKNIEMGDRVCVDTVSMMVPGEGMLIGSQAACLFLVQSESEDNGYVASRPFRVNAGAVHSYIEVPDGGTRYLSELRSGDDVLLCNGSGRTRVASIGRCKIEKRPLLMVTATDGMKEYSVILQNAETVKMIKKDGSESVTKLRPGDKILARIDTGGRHFGIPVDESISEI